MRHAVLIALLAAALPALASIQRPHVELYTDGALATFAVRALLGDDVELPPPGTPEGELYEQRVRELVAQSLEFSDGPQERALLNRYCVERYVHFQQLRGPSVDEACQAYWRYYDARFDQAATLQALVKMETLLPAISDEKTVRWLRTRFLHALGFERVYTRGRVQLHPRPVENWSYRTIRYAIVYARRHGLDPAFVDELIAALPSAPRFRCAAGEGYFVRPLDGGPLRYHRNHIESTVVSCGEAVVASDPELIAALPPIDDADDRTAWGGVRPRGFWVPFHDDDGNIAGSTLAVTVYWQEEF